MGDKLKQAQDYIIKNIPIMEYRNFAAKCKMQGKTVREVLIDFIKMYPSK
tara:strand:+ start:450 stop:599 length:150 start_codon:yes stop_codon:yes gene_type:complete